MKNRLMNNEAHPARDRIMVYAFIAVTQISCLVVLTQVFHTLATMY